MKTSAPSAPAVSAPVKETGKEMQRKRKDQLMKERKRRGMASTRPNLMGGLNQGVGMAAGKAKTGQ